MRRDLELQPTKHDSNVGIKSYLRDKEAFFDDDDDDDDDDEDNEISEIVNVSEFSDDDE
jgi:hypothetical protein